MSLFEQCSVVTRWTQALPAKHLPLALGLAVGSVWLVRPQAALANHGAGPETGHVCVADVGPSGCTANDFSPTRFQVRSITDACVNTTGDTGTAVFDADFSTSSPTRYDIGLFVGLDGSATAALNGSSCYHDYLPGPLSGTNTPPGPPYKDIDGDACGDSSPNQTWTRTTQSITFTCAKNIAGSNSYTIHVCASYDNNSNTTCSNVHGAVPGTSAKCQCTNFAILGPLAVDVTGLRASTAGDAGPQRLAIALMLGSVVAFAGMVWHRRQGVEPA